MRSFITLLFCLLPSLGLAQNCPTANDLTQGIRVDRSDGYTEYFRRGGQGIIAVQGFIDRKYEYDLELAGGLQLLSYSGNVGVTPEPDDGLTYDYGQPHAELPGPVPNGRWQSAVTVTGVGGPVSEPQLYAYGPLAQISIGGCPYAAISVTIAYQNDNNYIETVQFMPDLGISVLVQQGDDSGAPTLYSIDRIGIARQ